MCRENKMFMPDQTALNKLTTHKVIWPRSFNEQRKLHDNTIFQHFTTSFRLFPWLHTVSVKPWEKEKMHKILKLYEYTIYVIYEDLSDENRKRIIDFLLVWVWGYGMKGAALATIIGQEITAFIAIIYSIHKKCFFVKVSVEDAVSSVGSTFKVGLASFGLALPRIFL